MSLTWTAPAALWLLAAVPLVWLAYVAARTNFNPRQRALQTAIRSLLLIALAAAMARPVLSSSSSRQSIVYAVDVSHSVASAALDEAAKKIDAMTAALRPSHTRIVVFGKTAVAVPDTDALRRLAKADALQNTIEGLDRAGTDLENALLTARGELAPEHVPRIVIFSDGRATAGDTDSAAARLARERVPVFVEPAQVRSIGDAWVDGIDLPARIPSGGTVAATIAIGSQREGSGVIELHDGDALLARRPVAFSRGITPVAVDLSIDALGPHIVKATLTADGDPMSANNTLTHETWADPRSRVLYVEGSAESSRYLRGALTESGFDVAMQPQSALPASADGFDPYDVLILSDVSRKSLSEASMAAISEWVEQMGGGLLVAGGEAVYGEGGRGGYRKTAIERLTPVTFERKDEPEVALVIVLDRSWSMAGTSMDLTKTAAQAAVDVLSDEQSIGILTFNDKFAWDVPVRNVGEHRDSIRKKIAAIGPGGHTLIFPAVEQAYLSLRNVKARARHVILLSDGRSYPGDYETLLQKMVDARITVSTVAVGPSADPELLANLAKWGKGRAYVVADATQVPEIFVKEAKNAATPGFDEKSIKPVVKTPAFLSGVDLTKMPPLKGRTATVLKDSALELLATDEEDPLLAFWPIGLGRTAVFASDVKDRWAADWIRWRGYGPFFTAVVRALERRRPSPMTLEVVPEPVRGKSRTIAIAVEARDSKGLYRNLVNPSVDVRAAGGTASTVRTRQVSPGRYEATIVADADRALTVSLPEDSASGGVLSRTILPDPAAEYRFRPADAALLQSLSAATGGRVQPTPEALANVAGDTRTERRPLWPTLVAIALALWFLDILARRVRLFEPRVAE